LQQFCNRVKNSVLKENVIGNFCGANRVS